jgi:tetratricopeptide (TPR) repeat protein
MIRVSGLRLTKNTKLARPVRKRMLAAKKGTNAEIGSAENVVGPRKTEINPMTKASFSDKIYRLFKNEAWAEARSLLEAERERCPDDHWVITQLGVTYYEEGRYEEALKLFLASFAIVEDCPLTLWNLAGTYSALGKQSRAIRIYKSLLESSVSAEDDACWENKEWSEALKADCVYRLGRCFQKQGDKSAADFCYRQYIELLLAGIEGTYSIEEARRHVQSLHPAPNGKAAAAELKKLQTYLARHDSPGNGRVKPAARTKARV